MIIHEASVWLVTREYAVTLNNIPTVPLKSQQPLLLRAFHVDTKELLATFGPFDTIGDLRKFITENSITI